MSSNKGSTPKIEPTREFRPAGVNIKDAAISQERSGVVQTKAAAKSAPNAITPPLSERPVPTSSIAERIRERLKKGG
jgi:hypothetical protein